MALLDLLGRSWASLQWRHQERDDPIAGARTFYMKFFLRPRVSRLRYACAQAGDRGQARTHRVSASCTSFPWKSKSKRCVLTEVPRDTHRLLEPFLHGCCWVKL
jgi:hypothetical protein